MHGDAPSVESKETQQSAEKHAQASTIGKRFQHSKTPYDFDFEQSSGKSSMDSSRASSSPALAQGLEPESEMSPNTDPKRSNTHEFTTESSGMPRGRSNPVRIPFQQEVKPRTDTSAEKIKQVPSNLTVQSSNPGLAHGTRMKHVPSTMRHLPEQDSQITILTKLSDNTSEANKSSRPNLVPHSPRMKHVPSEMGVPIDRTNTFPESIQESEVSVQHSISSEAFHDMATLGVPHSPRMRHVPSENLRAYRAESDSSRNGFFVEENLNEIFG